MISKKTLLFCTSYSNNHDNWNKRYRKWLDYYVYDNKLLFDQCLIIDDGSPILPEWKDVCFTTKEYILNSQPNDKIIFVKFDKNLGRPNVHNYPGWFRGFKFAANYAKKFNFKKIIHLESDAYLISDKSFDYVNSLKDGWVSFWCKEHNFAESAIQIIGKDQIDNYYNFTNQNYEKFIGQSIECYIPFTHINKSLIGGRYGEFHKTLPKNIDFCCQFLNEWQF